MSDCDGVPGQQSRCTLCKEHLRGRHSHPGQWKSELQQFLLLKVQWSWPKFLYMHSPYSDVYHIGLTLIDPSVHDVYVQLSNISSLELRLLQLLLGSIIPLLLRPCVLQTLFICSGCDYVSVFCWPTMHTCSQDVPGTLADTGHDQMEEGFLSFVRLIGTVYF